MNKFQVVNNLSMLGLGLLFIGLFIGSLWLVIEGVFQLVRYNWIYIPLLITGTVGVFLFSRLFIEYIKYLANGD